MVSLGWKKGMWWTACACLLWQGCAPYRVVRLGPGVDERNIVTPIYAVVRNNVVIPEYVVDRFGNYPAREEEAQRRFQIQKDAVESLVKEKYDLSSSSQSPLQYFLGFCFALVSPIAIPLSWLGEAFSGQEKKRPFSKVVQDYYAASFYPTGYEKPRIRERVDYFY